MKKSLLKGAFIIFTVFAATCRLTAQKAIISSPDNRLQVTVSTIETKPQYEVVFDNKPIIIRSPLGLITETVDLSQGLNYIDSHVTPIAYSKSLNHSKVSLVKYTANELTCRFAKNTDTLSVIFRVSNNDVALCYSLNNTLNSKEYCYIKQEATGFRFPDKTTTFLTPQAVPGTGFKESKPSYEEKYVPDQPINTPSTYGYGYTFPALFHIGDNWVMISESGVDGRYCASHLSDATDNLYTIAFPDQKENNGIGENGAWFSLPNKTPWRTMTIGDNLSPIVETTVADALVEQRYAPSEDYKAGRSAWSWIIWQDASCNFEDQKTYIDMAAQMNYEYILIDAWWDKNIGYDNMKNLADYAASKEVSIFLWYNSNGMWNNTQQTPKNKMDNAVERKKEMAWMKQTGIKGIKVDFFGGDKQHTMKLYEEILSDANDYGLMVIFHGCTIPRGWDAMYPNFVGCEAALASENLVFTQYSCDNEAYNACLHPFLRNSIGSMDFGGTILNKRLSRNNQNGTTRRTSDTFQLATAVLFRSPIQNFALTPNNLIESPKFIIDFMKEIPTTWDDIEFIDGYPGKYCILARKNGDKWYVAAINAQDQLLEKEIKLPMQNGEKIALYYDTEDGKPATKETTVGKSGTIKISVKQNGGMIIKSR